MPAAATPEENYRLLYAIVKCSGKMVNTDWDEVSKMTGLTKSAVTQRFAKIKKAMDAGEGDSNPQPQAGSKKRTNDASKGLAAKKRKADAPVGGLASEAETSVEEGEGGEEDD